MEQLQVKENIQYNVSSICIKQLESTQGSTVIHPLVRTAKNNTFLKCSI